MGTSNNIEISSESLLQLNKVQLTNSAGNFSKTSFWYYTSVSTLNLILESGKIWASNIDKMNDINEAKLHLQDKSDIFALCFCNTNSEKIPMWYLYSGICGKGMRMGMTPAIMLSFLKSIDKVYPIDENGKVSDVPLIKDHDFSFDCGWIFYKKCDKCVKFKRKWYNIIDYEHFEDKNYFIKDYPWEYEKEFRIVFKNKTNNHFNRIAIEIPEDILKKLKLSYAPEVDFSEDIMSQKGFKKYLGEKIARSSLAINMNLLSRNKDDIVGNIDMLIDNKSATDICKAVQSQNYCSNIKGV